MTEASLEAFNANVSSRYLDRGLTQAKKGAPRERPSLLPICPSLLLLDWRCRRHSRRLRQRDLVALPGHDAHRRLEIRARGIAAQDYVVAGLQRRLEGRAIAVVEAGAVAL